MINLFNRHINNELLDRFRRELGKYTSPDQLPPLTIFHNADQQLPSVSSDADDLGQIITETFSAFNVPVEVIGSQTGPRMTQFFLLPQKVNGRLTKISAIKALDSDLSLALSASVSITTRPGKLILEIPNREFEPISLKSVMVTPSFKMILNKGGLPLALGKDASGQPIAADLSAMPHLLIAGATGSGKSVCMNACITSLLTAHNPEQLKLLLIDPKRVELVGYNGIRHLVRPVITDMEKAASALTWAVNEMDKRYELLSAARKRNIKSYNKWAKANQQDPLPFMVVIIDELADLMIQFKEEVESAIIRLAQMARAVGIHLILATQRPTVDVVTGLIKANVPARIAFAVASGTDSRVILDQKGAENLLGQGDCLYLPPGTSQPIRLQGCFVSDEEIEQLVEHWRA